MQFRPQAPINLLIIVGLFLSVQRNNFIENKTKNLIHVMCQFFGVFHIEEIGVWLIEIGGNLNGEEGRLFLTLGGGELYLVKVAFGAGNL